MAFLGYKWPKFKCAIKFEDFVLDAMKLKWSDPYATKVGRNGQPQNGVDVVSSNARFGAQCKNTESLSLKVIVAEILKATVFRPPLEQFIVATACDRDSRLQEEFRVWNAENPQQFDVFLMFWDDLVHEVESQENLVRKYRPELFRSVDSVNLPAENQPSVLLRIHLEIEMAICVRQNNVDADEFVLVSLKNSSDTEIVFDGNFKFRWRVTDAFSWRIAHVYDGLPGDPYWDEGCLSDGSSFELVIDPRGSIAAGGERTLGFVLFRNRLASRFAGGFALNDPYHRTENDQRTRIYLLLPASGLLDAPGACELGPRYALWDFNSLGEQTQISAFWRLEAGARTDAAGGTRDVQTIADDIAQRIGTTAPRYSKQ